MKGNMTVGQLIEELQRFDEDSEIRFAYNYGDHWNTQVAKPIRSIDSGTVSYSEYHRMDKVIEVDDEDYVEVIILS